ncbi:Glyoxylase, beta-lactamase superfamily II [Sphingomonas guangdongensis]|uniref:Glyoxylase, beta-lactamase superfamily II n=1 Tax=Sphingomonas guangdongensis TaxID=1141890 RepID=A0A285R0J4_9SPHN|nr:MBL fold metallo-hydrolase [Sphingomonas guangdongensis]SOB87354.1 Glyoxylase, beta-lactamase superfamily II [Sphingomonas guangdongensis]
MTATPHPPETLEPGVVRVTANNPSPFTKDGTQTYLVGEADVAVIDPGPADDTSHLSAILTAIDGRSVRAILCTHTHRDHSPLARALAAATGAPVVGCAPLALDDAGVRADAAFDRDYAPDRVLADGEAIEGADWSLTAVATPGHTSNHLCFAWRARGILFSGDHVMAWSTSIVSPPDGDMGDYMASLEKLLGRDDRVYYPGHGDAVTSPQRLVRGMMGHRRAREGAILRLVRGGEGDVTAMVQAMYAGLDPRLHPAAARSVLAHLFDLRRRALVTGEEGGVWRSAA